VYGMKSSGDWTNDKGANMLDGGAHCYDAYACADGNWISIGSLEPQFYALLREKAGLDDELFDDQWNRATWPQKKQRLAAVIRQRSRSEWCDIMEGSDVCFAPVLDLDEAPTHEHNKTRETFVTIDEVTQPNAAPRFSRTPGGIQGPPPAAGEHNDAALADWGFSATQIADLRDAQAI
ncbi:MAG: CoA transferase, partial [Acidobacteriota bacterium]|nr:CoA transferase [Acidobacteriota bacterium]